MLFTSIDDSTIFSNINSVGVSFGPDVNFNTFLNDLKSIAMSRLRETEKGEHNLENDLADSCEDVSEFGEELNSLDLNLLCGDLVEGV